MASRIAEQDALATATRRAPVTLERPVPADLSFEKPYLARALEAVDSDHPYGTPGRDHQSYSVLQQHVAFFDRNGDGIIYPWETYTGFRAIGFNPIIATLGMLIINGAFSFWTLPGWIPNLLFPLYIRNIHKAKHGSDTGVYDTEGRFVPVKFEELWTKYAKTRDDKMNLKEVWGMTDALRVAADPFGWFANKFEWFITFWLAKDESGYLPKEAVRGIYDGSFFEYVEKTRQNMAMVKQKLK